jgi:hypothetical protein
MRPRLLLLTWAQLLEAAHAPGDIFVSAATNELHGPNVELVAATGDQLIDGKIGWLGGASHGKVLLHYGEEDQLSSPLGCHLSWPHPAFAVSTLPGVGRLVRNRSASGCSCPLDV